MRTLKVMGMTLFGFSIWFTCVSFVRDLVFGEKISRQSVYMIATLLLLSAIYFFLKAIFKKA